jgi:hypothetical protein
VARPVGFLVFLFFSKIVCRVPNYTHGTTLPSVRQKALGKGLFVVKYFAMSFAKSYSQQTLCREELGLCREYRTHGILAVSRRDDSENKRSSIFSPIRLDFCFSLN